MLASLEETCNGWFSGRGLLERTGNERKATLEPAPESASTALTVRIRYVGGKIMCDPGASFTVRGSTYTNPVILTVDVEVDVDTEDGSFRETRPATLMQRSTPFARPDGMVSKEPAVDAVALDVSMPTSSLRGTFRSKDARDHDVVFWAVLGRTEADGLVYEKDVTGGFRASWH